MNSTTKSLTNLKGTVTGSKNSPPAANAKANEAATNVGKLATTVTNLGGSVTGLETTAKGLETTTKGLTTTTTGLLSTTEGLTTKVAGQCSVLTEVGTQTNSLTGTVGSILGTSVIGTLLPGLKVPETIEIPTC